jgi:hypothetical protein
LTYLDGCHIEDQEAPSLDSEVDGIDEEEEDKEGDKKDTEKGDGEEE